MHYAESIGPVGIMLMYLLMVYLGPSLYYWTGSLNASLSHYL